jgi:hypothetical protein
LVLAAHKLDLSPEPQESHHYCQWQGICSLGSGAVESAVKQIGHRVKLTGAQWKKENGFFRTHHVKSTSKMPI